MPDNLDDKLKEIKQMQQSAEQNKAALNTNIELIKTGIKEKKYTTGDSINDLMIVTYGLHPDADVKKKLRSLQKTISDNQNNQVLIVSRQQVQTEPRGCFGGGFSHIGSGKDLLGIINGTLLFDFEKYEVIIPTEKYAKRERYGKWQSSSGSIPLHILDFNKLDKWSINSPVSEILYFYDGSCGMHSDGHKSHQFRILTGKEVELFFKLQEDHYVWGSFGQAVLDKIRSNAFKEVPEDYFEIFGNIDTSYVTALQLLETEASKEFKKIRAQEIINKKDEVQKNILDSIDAALKDRRSDFETSKYNLVRTLRDAVELGMHKEERTVQYANIPGLSLDVKQYITYLCVQNKIPLE